ncbi:UNVERIFIED_CONTAM: hypothetical protein FKN15_028317 [Acipenser sinensis]
MPDEEVTSSPEAVPPCPEEEGTSTELPQSDYETGSKTGGGTEAEAVAVESGEAAEKDGADGEEDEGISSDTEEDASEVPGPRCEEGEGNPRTAPARMPATKPASAPAPDPATTSPQAATSPVVVSAPPGSQEVGNDGTVWNTINPGVEAAG